MEKIQIKIEKALTIIEEMIKPIAITREIGISPSWLTAKQTQCMNRHNKPIVFIDRDIPIINKSITSIGEKLYNIQLVYSSGREEVILKIKEALKYIKSSYLIYDILKKEKRWFQSRMAKPSKEGKKSSFTEDEVIYINLAIRDIANRLLSIEVIL